MNKKSGKSGTLVAPVAPSPPHEADVADVGTMAAIKAEQIKLKVGKFGAQKFKAFKAALVKEETEEKKEIKTSWIEIELVGEDKKPIPGERYRITLPDNSVAEGTLNEKGLARVEGFEPGSCKISFPDLDQDAWEDA